MSTSARRRQPAEVIGNAITLILLAAVSLLFIRWTEGDWWLATPRPGRWLLAATVLATYIAFCIWTWVAKRR